VQEKHVSKAFKNNPRQSQTRSELERIETHLKFSQAPNLLRDHQQLQISLHVEGWNNMFRDCLCGPASQALHGRWFGQHGLRMNTMQLYELGYFFQTNIQGRQTWQGQLGIIEGLNQYIWIGVTVGIALLVFDSLGYAYSIMDNGDDLTNHKQLYIHQPKFEFAWPPLAQFTPDEGLQWPKRCVF